MALWKTQKNHYVSQFILRGFSSNKEENKIWRYDLITSELRSEPDCLEVPISWVWFLLNWWAQEVENNLGNKFETIAAEIVDKIWKSIIHFNKYGSENHKLNLSKYDVNKITEFLVMQLARSVAISKYIEPWMNDTIDMGSTLQNIANNTADRVEEIAPEFIQDWPHNDNLTHKSLRSSFLNPVWLNRFSAEIWRHLRNKQMNVFWIPKNRWLIISDFPIAFPNQKYGVGYLDSEWWFPLTRNIVIAFWSIPNRDKIEYWYIPITPKELNYLNRDIACQATRYIFWHNRELVLKYWNMHKKIKASFIFDNLN